MAEQQAQNPTQAPEQVFLAAPPSPPTQNAQSIPDTDTLQPPVSAPEPGIPVAGTPMAPPKTGIFDKVLETIAGNPKSGGQFNPATGKIEGGTSPSRASLGMHIMAAAITGMLKGAAAKPGPGHAAQGAEAGFEAGQQLNPTTQAKNQYEEGQQDQVRKLQIAGLNGKVQLDLATTGKLNSEQESEYLARLNDPDSYSQDMRERDQAGADNNTIVSDSEGKPLRIPASQALQDIKSGKYGIGTHIGQSSGGGVNPTTGKVEPFVTIVQNPEGQLPYNQETKDRWESRGVNAPPVPSTGTLPAKSIATYEGQYRAHDAGPLLISTLKADIPNNPEFKIPDKLPQTPGMVPAITEYQRILLHGKPEMNAQGKPTGRYTVRPNDPIAAIDAMTGTNRSTMIGALGLSTNWQQFKEAAANQVDVMKQAALAPGRLAEEGSLEDQKANKEKYPQDAISAAVGGTPRKDANGQWSFNGRNYPSETAAGKAFGSAYDSEKERFFKTEHPGVVPPSEADQAGLITAMGEGRMAGPNTRTVAGQTLAARITKEFPDYDETLFPTYKRMREDYASGKTGRTIIALNTALTHLGRMNSNLQYWSTGVSGGLSKELGGDITRQLETDRTAVSDELGKVYNDGVITDQEKKDWQNLLSSSGFLGSGITGKQVQTNIREMTRLLGGKQDSVNFNWDRNMPHKKDGTAVAPNKPIISPEAQTARDGIFGGKPSATTAPAGAKDVFINGQKIGWTTDGIHIGGRY